MSFMFIDTHAHLYLDQFNEDSSEVIRRAKEEGVQSIFLPNIDVSTISSMNDLRLAHPDFCYSMIGLHPCSVKEDYKAQLDHMKSELETSPYHGIGETGIDLYWDSTYKSEQIESFECQIEWAKDKNLPIIIHSRNALELTIDIIGQHQDGTLRGIFHCFNGTVAQCRQIADMGFMMGLGGVITYKKAALDEMVKYMPIEHMLLETDAPYLSPVPFRGKRNESGYLKYIADKVAVIREATVAEVATFTTKNAQTLFHSNVLT